jgi:tryptophan-rich sensory protein
MSFANYPLFTIVTVAVITLIVAIAGGLCTQIGPWYRALNKPSWQPPDWLFGPAWTVIFVLAAYAAIDSYTQAPPAARSAVVAVFAINAVLNVLWSFCFFTMKSPMLALYEVVLLLLSIVSIMVVIAPYSRSGVWALTAYLAWVSFAAFLNYTVVKLNAPGHSNTP